MALSELPSLSGDPEVDVTVRVGQVPPALDSRRRKQGLFETAPGQFLLCMPGIARYLVSSGNSIVVELLTPSEADVRLYLLETVFGALLHQRGVLPLHGSAVETAQGVVLLTGVSGTGKSALAAVFHARGYPIAADEICAVRTAPEGPKLAPSFPRIVLARDVIDRLGLDGEGPTRIRAGVERYHVPIRRFSSETGPVVAIYVLNTTNEAQIGISELTGHQKIQALMNITYRVSVRNGMCAPEEYFSQISMLARKAPVKQLMRPDQGFRLEEVADAIERDLNQ